LLSLIIDIIILLCLGATIFYAMRLSTALNNFKAHRKEFQGLMSNLSQNIAQAQSAISGLKSASQKTGEQLQDKVNDAAALCDELQLMTGAGNRLASRLEALAEQNGKARMAQDDVAPDYDAEGSDGRKPNDDAAAMPSFFIQDPDFKDDDYEGSDNIAPFAPRPDQSDPDEDSLQSEAEKDLLRALKQNKKS